MPLFTFSLDSFQITQTRSPHKDSDYVIFTRKITSSGLPESFPVKSLGNLNNGTFNIGLTSSNNLIYPDSPVVVNYLIVNSSIDDPNTITAIMEEISVDLANGPLLGLPPFTSALQYVTEQYAGQLNSLTKGSCDGLVAAEQNNFTYEELVNYTSRSPYFTQATPHIGTKAPSGCNSKLSDYVTYWSMMQVAEAVTVSVPPLKGLQLGAAEQNLSNIHLQPCVEKNNSTSPKSYVIGQNPLAGKVVAINSTVTLETNLNAQ